MIIKADKEGQQAIAKLADVVLKSVGLQGFQEITRVLNSIIPIGENMNDQRKEIIIDKNESTE